MSTPDQQTIETLGKYHILGELGSGGFATVFRALDTTLDREVALKVLHPQLLVDQTTVARFQREARAAARLQHPNIVTIYEVGAVGERLYIAMALAEGGSLASRLAAQGTLPWAETLRLLQAISSALDYAHAQQIVHRDLKPANILLNADGIPWVTDFGFARLLADTSVTLSNSDVILGTPSYIAPELWERQTPTPAGDIYAMGCIVYELLTGERAFGGDTPLAVVSAHQQGFTPPTSWPREIPEAEAVEAVLLCALSKAPEERYARAGELVAALQAIDRQHVEEQAQQTALGTLLAQARAACEAGDWLTAQSACVQVMVIDRSHPEALAMMTQATQALQHESTVALAQRQRARRYEAGVADLKQEKWEEAVDVLSQVATEDPDFEDVQAKLAQAQMGLQVQIWRTEASEAMSTEKWSRACALWVNVLRNQDDDRESQSQLLIAVEHLVEAHCRLEIDLLQQRTIDMKAQATGILEALEKPYSRPIDRCDMPSDDKLTGEESLEDSIGREPGIEWQIPVPAGTVQVWEKDGKEMIYVPAGEFHYGDHKRELSLPGYWIDKAPVTNIEYARFVAATEYTPPQHWHGSMPPQNIAEHPVVLVSWHDAMAYCEWAGKRLPTEYEWEKAARGTDGRIFPWGNEAPTPELCNFDDQVGNTTPVGQYSPAGDSPYGCMDMAGNVWEWTSTKFDYANQILRGGSWCNNDWEVRSAERGRYNPISKDIDSGFRCAFPQSSQSLSSIP